MSADIASAKRRNALADLRIFQPSLLPSSTRIQPEDILLDDDKRERGARIPIQSPLCITPCLCPCVAERASRRAGTDTRSGESVHSVVVAVVVAVVAIASSSLLRVARPPAIPTTDNLPADPPPRGSASTGPARCRL